MRQCLELYSGACMMEQSTTNLNFWGSSTAASDIRKKFQKCYYLPLEAHLVEPLTTDSHFEGFESTNDWKKIPKMRQCLEYTVVAYMMEQSTIDLNFRGSSTAASDIRKFAIMFIKGETIDF